MGAFVAGIGERERTPGGDAGARLSAELRLAAACCRIPGPERDAAVRACADEVRWPEFLATTRRHRIEALVREALARAGVTPPQDVAEPLARGAERVLLSNMALAAETLRLQRAFDDAGVAFVTLKGAALAQAAYGSLGLKHARDVDVLTSRAHAAAAWALLERQGYVLSQPAARLSEAQKSALLRFGREVEFVRTRPTTVVVELKWRLVENPMLLRGVDAHSPTIEVPLLGAGALRTLADADNFAYLCAHGAHHFWARLKWLADLNAFADGHDLGFLYDHAQRLGAGLCAAQALLLCREFFGLTLPDEVAARASRDPRVARLTAMARAEIQRETSAPDTRRVVRNVVAQFRLGEGWRFALSQAGTSFFGDADVVQAPLPPRLQFLYPLLHLPLWLLRRFGPGRPGARPHRLQAASSGETEPSASRAAARPP